MSGGVHSRQIRPSSGSAGSSVGRIHSGLDRLVKTYAPFAARGVPIVGLEPSCLYSFRDEIPSLLKSEEARQVAERVVRGTNSEQHRSDRTGLCVPGFANEAAGLHSVAEAVEDIWLADQVACGSLKLPLFFGDRLGWVRIGEKIQRQLCSKPIKCNGLDHGMRWQMEPGEHHCKTGAERRSHIQRRREDAAGRTRAERDRGGQQLA